MIRSHTRRRPTATAPPDPAPVRASARRATLAALALVLGLAACQPIVVDGDDVSSHATMAASPVTVAVGGTSVAAVEIRMRDCHSVRYEGSDVGDLHLRPIAFVEDADGTVLFANMRGPGSEDHVVPPGSKVTDGGTDGPHRIVVPVAGADLPLAIGAGCTLYGGVGSGGPFGTWSFPTCTAWRRTCLATDPGQGEWSD